MMMMMITLALCMAVASWSSTLSWLLRKPSFLLLSSTWQTNYWETVIWCLQPFKKQMHGVPSYWWFWFYIEIVIMIIKPLPSSFSAPQQAPEALEPRLQNWLKSIDKCLHIYSWKTSKASMNNWICTELLCRKWWAKTCYFDRVPVQELLPAQQAGENGIKIMLKLNWKALFKTNP